MRKTVFLPVLLGMVLGGCEPQAVMVTTNEGPVAYGANGLSAPAVYTIAPRAPKSMGHPAIAMANVPVGTPPQLPPVDRVFPENSVQLREPLINAVNPDLVAKRPMPVEGLDSRFPMPVEQEVYGGVHGQKGEDAVYLYQDGDSLNIHVNGQPEFNGTAKVESDGRVRIPGTEDYVLAAGRDAQQIQSAIVRTVRPYVRAQPVVRVTPEVAQGGYYTIFGGVGNQGRFPIGSKPIRLSEAVFRADSQLLERAKTLNALGNDMARENFARMQGGWLGEVILVTPHQNFPEVSTHNVARSLFGGKREDDPVVKSGQIIIVRDKTNPELEMYVQQILAGHYPQQKALTPVAMTKPMPLVVEYRQPVSPAAPEPAQVPEAPAPQPRDYTQEHGPATALLQMMGKR